MFQFPGFECRLHLDFETFSREDLGKAGVHRYAQHPSTEVLMLAWAIDDGPVFQWLPHRDEFPQQLFDFLQNPQVAKVAFNAAFERLIFEHVLGIHVPVEEWRCTMVASYYLGFVGGLDAVLSQTPLDHQKDPRGKQLIQRFSKPAPSNHHADRYTHENKLEEFQEFCEYNVQDVVVERKLLEYLAQFPMMADWDWQRYVYDQRINDRGIYMDTEMAEGAMSMWKEERKSLTEQLCEHTGLPKVTRGPFMEWLQSQGVILPDMRKDTLQPLVDDETVAPHVRTALSLWMAKEAKATSKYAAVIAGACHDQRARGMFQFKGASRTDRTAGRRIQLQNLKRSVTDSQQGMANLRNAIATGNPGVLQMISGDSVSDALGYSIRHCIQAAPGNLFAVADLTSIESVVLGWLTYCSGINEIFESGKDTYKPFAATHYRVAYEEVTKAQRTFAKPAILGCGFMLGAKGLLKYAEAMGVEMDMEESNSLVSTFRNMYHEVPQFWQWIDQAVKYTIQTGQPCDGYRLHLEKDREFLRIWLPSGRALSYHLPAVERRVAPWAQVEVPYDFGNRDPLTCIRAKFPNCTDVELAERGVLRADQWVDNVSYMGTDPITTQWGRIYVHAGSFTENIVQSLAYDILFGGIGRAESHGIPIVLQVHDELATEVPKPSAEVYLERLKDHMTRRPDWAPDIWLGAEGYVSKYFKKD